MAKTTHIIVAGLGFVCVLQVLIFNYGISSQQQSQDHSAGFVRHRPDRFDHGVLPDLEDARQGDDAVDESSILINANARYHVVRRGNKTCEIDPSNTWGHKAIQNAPSDLCKMQIKDTVCRSQAGELYPTMQLSPLPSCTARPTRPLNASSVLQQPTLPSAKVHTDGDAQPVRIAYMIVCHGRSVRQVKRLLRMVYAKRHVYLIHVDSRADFMYQNLLRFAKPFENVYLTSWRLGTIWGGSNLYEVYMRGIADLLAFPWDYFINLSGADLPIAPPSHIESFLAKFRAVGANFMTTHRDHVRFVQKQGFNRTFVLCDNHMHIVADRAVPPDLALEGGSDWYMLHRSFCAYVVAPDNALVASMRPWFDHTLLAAESFFHIVIANSPLCNTYVGKNYRKANWIRDRGCHCQYRKIVDWCGCSPNVFITESQDSLRAHQNQGYLFARKFDGKISNSIIDFVESELVQDRSLPTPKYYWENVYSRDLDTKHQKGPMTYFAAFGRFGLQNLSSLGCTPTPLQVVLDEVFFISENDLFVGYIVALRLRFPSDRTHAEMTRRVELLVRHTSHTKVFHHTPKQQGGPGVGMAPWVEDDDVAEKERQVLAEEVPVDVEYVDSVARDAAHPKLLVPAVGVSEDFDKKEVVFANRRGGLLTVDDTMAVGGLWRIPQPVVEAQIQWERPADAPNADEFWINTFTHGTGKTKEMLHVEYDGDSETQPRTPGLWTAKLLIGTRVVSTMIFPVVVVHDHLHSVPRNSPRHYETIRQFWKVESMCIGPSVGRRRRQATTQEDHEQLCARVLPACVDQPWSTMRPQDDITANDIIWKHEKESRVGNDIAVGQ
eukprot:m.678698 g.678698  ORF g.678698 m.678698 type:complete len:834 (-) comp22808_c0_seq3:104-2605(-)